VAAFVAAPHNGAMRVAITRLSPEAEPADPAREALRRIWGHAEFRGLQAAIVAEVMNGGDVLAVLPTGGGKSVCYQIPAILRRGVGLVVSPLIALMADQVEGLKQLGVAAARLDSGLESETRAAVWRAAEAGELDLLYVSPEGLAQPYLVERLQRLDLSLIAIDEAHCVSQWGHDFRPDYRTLGRLAETFPGVPRLALTATADARTRDDILSSLHLDTARVFVDSFARPNLALKAERKESAGRLATDRRVAELVAARRGKAGIVYCGSRDGTERLAETLAVAGIPALAYHAGLDAGERDRRLTRFLNDDAGVMVATIAFGMGVDKPDVRFVIHADPPGSIEAYWQEVGRAGRDGDPAEGITLYGAADIAWALRRIDGRDLRPEVKSVQVRKARQLYAMLDGAVCRAAAVRTYFGEAGAGRCGVCDICREPPSLTDATEAAQKALAAVQRLGGRLGRGRVIDHLTGRTKDVRPDESGLSTYGIGRDIAPRGWRDVIDHLLFEGLLLEDPNDGKPLLALGDTEAVREVYRGQRRIAIRRAPDAYDPSTRSGDPRRRGRGDAAARESRSAALDSLPAAARERFDSLRAWRRERAAEQGVPPYVIFHDAALIEIARANPARRAELAEVQGVGQAKLDRYGAAVLALLSGMD
jgi:ATP-dependent DNA helicase RecQ